MSRRDDVTDLYKPSSYLEIIEKVLFAIDIVAALVSLLSDQSVSSIAITIQIIVALLYFIISTVDDGIFWYKAEQQRRKNSIENGFGIRLSEYETDGYYNNDLEPSLEKYGLNTLESNYFSKSIAGKMILKSSVTAIVAVIALIIACRFLQNGDILLIIAQTAFSSYILVDLVMLIIYKERLETLYKEAYDAIIVLNVQGNHRRPWLLAYIMEYEAVKAHYKVRLDSKVFNKCNTELSQKWQDILSHRSSNDGEAE